MNNSQEHEFVDLGLPSGTLWAICNVGASKPEDKGGYFAWGEIMPKSEYNWNTYKYSQRGIFYKDDLMTKYCNKSKYGYGGFTDELAVLQSSDDAATVNWGREWRMPTKMQWDELISNTKNSWTRRNGVNGRLFTASNCNTLFLPDTGYLWYSELGYGYGSGGHYWSSSIDTDSPRRAWYFGFYSDRYGVYYDYRYYGLSVRAVRFTPQN